MFTFHKVRPSDLPILHRWQTLPHVRKWWDAAEPENIQALKDPRVARWIVHLNGRAFAYMQDYSVHGWKDHHFYDLPAGTRGIDQFIGVPECVGKGCGPAFMAQRVATLFAEGAPVIATDPDPANTYAISAYQKVGFQAFGPPQHTPWGRVLPMKVAAETFNAGR